MKFETIQLHTGQHNDSSSHAFATPIYQTASYAFDNSAHGAALFNLEQEGNIYTRIGNPTSQVLEERIAALEGGVGALAVSSGQSATFLAIATLAKHGHNIVASPALYGGSVTLCSSTLARFGIDVRFAQQVEIEDFERLIDENTRALFVESIGNPAYIVPHFEKFAKLANKHQIPLIVDNTLGAAGYLVRPLDLGAHIVTASTTKFINGHGNAIGGIIVDGGSFDWSNGKFPEFTDPCPSYHGLKIVEACGEKAFITKVRIELLRDLGTCPSPFNSFLTLQGLQTLSLRIDRHCSNALALAQWLEQQVFVSHVNYLGLTHHPSHELAKKYVKNGFGSMISFELKGDKTQTTNFVDNLKIITHLANLGDTRSLIIQPSATTHQQLTAQEQLAAGVSPNLLRLSVGLENIEDLQTDILQAATT